MSHSISNGGRPAPPWYDPADFSAQKRAGGATEKTPAPLPTRSATAPTRQDVAVLACSVLLALFWCAAVSPFALSALFGLAGGAALCAGVLGFLGCALALAARRARWTRWSRALVALTLGLACVPALTADEWVRALNAPVLALSCMLTYLLLSGHPEGEVLGASGPVRGVAAFVRAQFAHWGDLAKVVSARGRGGWRAIGSVVVGALCALVVLAWALPLLASADAAFGALVGDALDVLLGADATGRVMDVCRFAIVLPMCFSLLFGVLHAQPRPAEAGATWRGPRASVASVGTMLVLLDAVYLAFVVVQSSYLFGGPGALGLVGGYAAYARSGFFELVGVAALNLAVVLICIWLRADATRSRVICTLELALVGSTAVMLVSAAWRMGLYVGEYGLTRLRLLTIWGMVAIAFLLALAVAKALRPRTRLFRAALVGVLGLWLAFALVGPDALIAQVNVYGYLSGSIERVDVDYLGGLSADAVGPIARLACEARDPNVAAGAAQARMNVASAARLQPWQTRGL
ncbi:DUF4153 domain-containing protein [Thermophilibacter immobilis]|uniref:DUF4173 domain-containing protein n=1 Tax=Thermophilibacter immobilis TaxID=2779519 RepID=A0A7S7RV95_9ACTN|nr:DUF4173 domain-containing protein [Thermophilibacter immobilis]QOY61262.1 DUF4173 domain-containing protein [Thermophilibacter immobilis]